MPFPIFAEIERLIVERGSAAVRADHIALLKEKIGLLREDFEKLENENKRLVARNSELEAQAKQQQSGDEYVEQGGALFKRMGGGRYSDTPVCPHCRRTMFSFENEFPFSCSNKACGHIAAFNGFQLEHVMSKLPT